MGSLFPDYLFVGSEHDRMTKNLGDEASQSPVLCPTQVVCSGKALTKQILTLLKLRSL